MLNFKKYWLIIILLFLCSGKIMAGGSQPVQSFFAGLPVDPDTKVIEVQGDKFVNLLFLNKYLQVVSNWETESVTAEIRFGGYDLILTAGSREYLQNKERQKLTVAPFKEDDQFWIPLELLKRWGLSVQRQNSKELWLDWKDNYLLRIEEIKYQNRPAFLLVGTKALTVKQSNLIINPDRLLVDLPNQKLHPAFQNCTPGDSNVRDIRLMQRDDGSVRLIFDLAKLLGYKTIQDPNHPEQLILVFNYFLQEVSFLQKDGFRKVQIKTSLPAEFKVLTLSNPNRLVIDFEGATVNTSNNVVSGDGTWIDRIRTAQFDPRTVRVVLDLKDPVSCYVTRSISEPNLVEVRTVQNINQITWLDGKEDRLVITGENELDAVIQKLKATKKLTVSLNYVQLRSGLEVSGRQSDLTDGLKIIPSPTKVEMEIDLKDRVITNTEFTMDHRQLIIHFRPSSLYQKTIVLDAGHGGVDPGACGCQGTREKEVTLDVTMRLKDLLEEAGANVILTRMDDSYISLYERPMIANNLFADAFISIHCNSFPNNSTVRGIEVYYYPERPAGKVLAGLIAKQVITATGLNNRGIRGNERYVVLREPLMVSILAELGYLSNFEEETLLRSGEFRSQAANGIFQGLADYYQ